ncbi:putative ribonuclease H-like domain-containing protein [Tanacetum coccineum]
MNGHGMVLGQGKASVWCGIKEMDVKSAFLYGKIEEEVYVCQPPGFEDADIPDRVYKMISMGELTFFLGLQVKQKNDGIFISQDKYVAKILKKFDYKDVRIASTLIDTEKALQKDLDGDDVDVHLYRSMIGSLMYLTSTRPDIMFAVCAYSPFKLVPFSDSDYVRASLDKKSTIGGCQFLGCRLISWQCKKQTMVSTSSTEAEYMAAASCCEQVLWIQNQMLDYGLIQVVKIYTDNNFADLLTKALDVGRISTARHIKQIKRGRDTKIPQSSGPLEKVGDEAIHKELGDRMEKAVTTASSLEAEQDNGNNNRTKSMATLNEASP